MDLGISRAEFKVFQTVNITDFIVILSELPLACLFRSMVLPLLRVSVLS
jgi:hypothetical protein